MCCRSFIRHDGSAMILVHPMVVSRTTMAHGDRFASTVALVYLEYWQRLSGCQTAGRMGTKNLWLGG
eukprot:10942725-Ditylum_brightwellii.AAC.1